MGLIVTAAELDYEAPLSHFFALPPVDFPAENTETGYMVSADTRFGQGGFTWSKHVKTNADGGITVYNSTSGSNTFTDSNKWSPNSASGSWYRIQQWHQKYTTSTYGGALTAFKITTSSWVGGGEVTTTSQATLTKPTVVGSNSSTTSYHETITTVGYSTSAHTASLWVQDFNPSSTVPKTRFQLVRGASGEYSETSIRRLTQYYGDRDGNTTSSETNEYSNSASDRSPDGETYTNDGYIIWSPGGWWNEHALNGLGKEYDPMRVSVYLCANPDETLYYHSDSGRGIENPHILNPGESTSYSYTYKKYHGNFKYSQVYGKEVPLVIRNGCPPSSQAPSTEPTETTLTFAESSYSYWPAGYDPDLKFKVFNQNTVVLVPFTTALIPSQQIVWPLPIGYSCSTSSYFRGDATNFSHFRYTTNSGQTGNGRVWSVTTYSHPQAEDRIVFKYTHEFFPAYLYLFGSGQNGYAAPTRTNFHTEPPEYSSWSGEGESGLANNFVRVKLPSLVSVSSGGYTFSLDPSEGYGTPTGSGIFDVEAAFVTAAAPNGYWRPIVGADMASFTSSVTEINWQIAARLFNGDSSARQYAACGAAAHRVSLVLKEVNSTGYGSPTTAFEFNLSKSTNNIVTMSVPSKKVYAPFVKRDLSDYLHPDLGNTGVVFRAVKDIFMNIMARQALSWMESPEVAETSWLLSSSRTPSFFVNVYQGTSGGGGYGGSGGY